MNSKLGTKQIALVSSLLLTILFIATPTTHAAFSCTLDRDLDIGIEGDDVLCLQQFLNTEGYTLTSSGAGAPGAETNRFGGLTRDALARWQTDNDIYPASGYLGPLTRAVLQGTTPTATTPTTTGGSSTSDIDSVLASLGSENQKQATDLLALFDALGITKTGVKATTQTQTQTKTTSSVTESTSDLDDQMLKAVKMIREAKDAIDDTDVSDEDLTNAKSNYEDARDDLVKAVYAYFMNKTDDALEYADDAYDNAKDALEDAGSRTEEDEVDEWIEDVEDMIEDAWDELEDAEDDDADTSDAEDYLADAEAVLDDAKDAFENDELADAEDYLEEAEDLVDDALDAIVTEDAQDAQDAIEDAEDAIDEAFDAIRDARDDGDDVDDAEDDLDKAEALLEDAEDAYDDEEYDDAIDYANDAEDYAEKAMDRL